MTILLHGGSGELLFAEYLYRVGLHLSAAAAVAVVVHWLVGVIGRTATSGAEDEVESRGR